MQHHRAVQPHTGSHPQAGQSSIRPRLFARIATLLEKSNQQKQTKTADLIFHQEHEATCRAG